MEATAESISYAADVLRGQMSSPGFNLVIPDVDFSPEAEPLLPLEAEEQSLRLVQEE